MSRSQKDAAKRARQPDQESRKSRKKVKPDDAQYAEAVVLDDSTMGHGVEGPNEVLLTEIYDEEAKQPAEPELFALTEATLDNIKTKPDKLRSFLRQADREIEKIKGDRTLTMDERFDKSNFLGNLQGMARTMLKSLVEASVIRNSLPPPRIVNVDFEIVSQKLLHNFDFIPFKGCIRELFGWHTTAGVRAKYMAPCRPLVQSSGMGKTKLQWELHKLVNTKEPKKQDAFFKDCFCEMILCAHGEPEQKVEKEVFNSILDVPSGDQPEDSKNICNQLHEIVSNLLRNIPGSKNGVKVILLFDESQHLITNDGFAYRAVRWWLRLQHNFHAVAIFTGTTSRLTNFFQDPPKSINSRQAGIYHASGKSLFDPFYQITTIGLFARHQTIQPTNDYQRAVPYGRPLFALMQEKGKLNDREECNALRRMLMSQAEDWSNNLEICLSILGTRLQMGQTSVRVASDLVAKGYAVLSHYVTPTAGKDSGTACVFFPTDPVCGRLAMALMDETWTVTSDDELTFNGQAKPFWTRKISEIFSTGLCRPPQGDFGEIAAASYLLFCGDILRMRIDKTYRTFSVPLSDFFECLLKPKFFYKTRVLPLPPEQAIAGYKYSTAHVNFIQVTRNYLRFSVKDFFHDDFLRDLYYSGSAFFTYPMFTVFDLVASIRLVEAESGEETFVPLLVSVSTEMYIGTQRDWLDKIVSALEGRRTMEMEDVTEALGRKAKGTKAESKAKAKAKSLKHAATSRGGIIGPNGKGFVGLRLLFNRSGTPYDSSADILSVNDVDCLLQGEVVWKVVIVPNSDPFGIVDMLLDATLCGSEQSEIYSSHSFAFNHGMNDVQSKALVRKKNAAKTTRYLDELRAELLESRTKQQIQQDSEEGDEENSSDCYDDGDVQKDDGEEYAPEGDGGGDVQEYADEEDDGMGNDDDTEDDDDEGDESEDDDEE